MRRRDVHARRRDHLVIVVVVVVVVVEIDTSASVAIIVVDRVEVLSRAGRFRSVTTAAATQRVQYLGYYVRVLVEGRGEQLPMSATCGRLHGLLLLLLLLC